MRLPLLSALCLLLAAAAPARAAESYDSCTGTISTLPAVITTQGTWCLKSDLATGLSSGDIIRVDTNNVVIDCNGFKLGNLAAGVSTQSVGIKAVNRLAVTVRNCNLRGFHTAILLNGSGHLVEDNRIEASRRAGILTDGAGATIRRNFVLDTGGIASAVDGISAFGDVDVRDNVVDGVLASPSGGADLRAIRIRGIETHFTVRGNVVRRVGEGANGVDYLFGIQILSSGHGDVIDNTVWTTTMGFESYGIYCSLDRGFVRDNRATGFAEPFYRCPAGTGNESR